VRFVAYRALVCASNCTTFIPLRVLLMAQAIGMERMVDRRWVPAPCDGCMHWPCGPVRKRGCAVYARAVDEHDLQKAILKEDP
jgi:hypothetical protein